MLALFEKVLERINGDLAEAFRLEAFGEHLSGLVTFSVGARHFTWAIHKGAVVEASEGVPLTGLELGVGGPEEGWEELFEHRNFSRAIAPKHGRLSLQGDLVKAMGNLNALGFLASALCEAKAEAEAAGGGPAK